MKKTSWTVFSIQQLRFVTGRKFSLRFGQKNNELFWFALVCVYTVNLSWSRPRQHIECKHFCFSRLIIQLEFPFKLPFAIFVLAHATLCVLVHGNMYSMRSIPFGCFNFHLHLLYYLFDFMLIL